MAFLDISSLPDNSGLLLSFVQMFPGLFFWCLNSSSLNIDLLIMCSNGNVPLNSLNVVTESVFVITQMDYVYVCAVWICFH